MIDVGKRQSKELAKPVAQLQSYSSAVRLPAPLSIPSKEAPEGLRDPNSHQLLHDDYLMANALVAVLDRLEWSLDLPGQFLRPPDPLDDMSLNR